jgi:CAAX prenyl protease-like protein
MSLTDVRVLSRALPFALYMVFLAIEGGAASVLPGLDPRWLYPVKVAGVAALLWVYRRHYRELFQRPDSRWVGLVAPALGVAVFILWINLDAAWLTLGGGGGFDPRDAGGAPRWELVLPRLAGAAIVVPIMEELFWRSFLLRWIDRPDFLALEPARISLRALLIAGVLFGLEHTLWFAGILAGLAYGWLYRASGNLWAPIAAHATTNLLLGLWVLSTGSWSFW